MEIILLEKIQNLGQLGDVVVVKDGYARNFLIPNGKAQRATKANREVFEQRRQELEESEKKMLEQAQEKAKKMTELTVNVSQQASIEGRLFGSVTNHDIADLLQKAGHDVKKSSIQLPHGPIKEVGEHSVAVSLHPDVSVQVSILVEPE
tara:strand:- start:528 stop:974 length:447 start_codon:yes stop_codon:yes gene_type:complete